MAVPTFVTDLTDISLAENTTDWNGIGGVMSPIAVTDFYRQGAGSVGGDGKGATGRRGVAFDYGVGTGTIDFTAPDTYLYIWIWVASENIVDTIANFGVNVYASSNAGGDADYNEYTVGGSNASWVGKGWKMFVVDLNRTPDRTSGTPDLTAMRQFGITIELTATLGKADAFAVDALRYGSKVELTGGTSGDPISFQTIADQDGSGGADTQYGCLYEDATGSKLLNGGVIIGDEAGATNTWLESSNEIVLITQELVPDSANYFAVDADTGTTTCRIGTEVGSGDDSRGVGGGLFKSIGSANYLIDGSRTFNEFSLWGGNIDGAGSILLQNTNVEWVGCTINASGQIVLDSGAELREGFIVGSIASTGSPAFGAGSPPIRNGAILLTADPTTPEFRDMTLINNPYGIEWTTNGPITLNLRNIIFAGNTYDFVYNHASGLLTVNLIEGSTNPINDIDGGFGGTITIPAATYTFTITGVQTNSEVRIFEDDADRNELDGTENTTGGVTKATIVNGGTGYSVSDTLTIVGGTGTAGQLTVTSVSGGVVTGVSVATPGVYSANPTNPASVTGGTGNDDATFRLSVSGLFSYTYPYTVDIPIYAVIFHLDFKEVRLTDLELSTADQSFLVQQPTDRVYSNP